MRSNLRSFLDCTTPLVPSHCLPNGEIKKCNRLWHFEDEGKVEYFTLADLWDCYDEWSAYGAGVPIMLNNGDTVVQYYAPYLSAIQIFTTSSMIESLRDETGSRDDQSLDYCSYGNESNELSKCKVSLSDGVSEDIHVNDRLGSMYFQYFDQSAPYGRIPLTEKVNELAKKFPGLMSLRSVDLSPASWMAIAWYPIYHIPVRRTTKSLSTRFLTYHTLSSSFPDMDSDYEIRKDIYLRPFGMATYHLQGSVWASSKNGCLDHQMMGSLLSVADSWLKQLRVQHHDFNHFTGKC